MTTDIQDTTLYWELLDTLPPNADDYVEDWIRTNSPKSDSLSAEEHKSFQEGYLEWGNKAEERSGQRVENCRERLSTAFHSEQYGSDFVIDVVNLFEEVDDHGENLISCLVQFLLDAADGDTFVNYSLKEIKNLRENAGSQWMVNVFSHANKQGESAWSKLQHLKGSRRKQIQALLDPSRHRHPDDKYNDAERRLDEWCESLETPQACKN